MGDFLEALGRSGSPLLGDYRRSSCLAFRGSKWYARPVTLRNPALIQCDAGYKSAGSL